MLTEFGHLLQRLSGRLASSKDKPTQVRPESIQRKLESFPPDSIVGQIIAHLRLLELDDDNFFGNILSPAIESPDALFNTIINRLDSSLPYGAEGSVIRSPYVGSGHDVLYTHQRFLDMDTGQWGELKSMSHGFPGDRNTNPNELFPRVTLQRIGEKPLEVLYDAEALEALSPLKNANYEINATVQYVSF